MNMNYSDVFLNKDMISEVSAYWYSKLENLNQRGVMLIDNQTALLKLALEDRRTNHPPPKNRKMAYNSASRFSYRKNATSERVYFYFSEYDYRTRTPKHKFPVKNIPKAKRFPYYSDKLIRSHCYFWEEEILLATRDLLVPIIEQGDFISNQIKSLNRLKLKSEEEGHILYEEERNIIYEQLAQDVFN